MTTKISEEIPVDWIRYARDEAVRELRRMAEAGREVLNHYFCPPSHIPAADLLTGLEGSECPFNFYVDTNGVGHFVTEGPPENPLDVEARRRAEAVEANG